MDSHPNATIESTPTALVLNRETGTLVPSQMTVGSAAVISAGLKELRQSDFDSAISAGDKITTLDHDYTIVDNNTGASVGITASRAVVGTPTTTAQWSNISAPKALKAAFLLAGAMAPHVESALADMLNAVADGASWDAAFDEILGDRMTTERLERADEKVSELRRSVVQTRAGKQQATGVSVSRDVWY